MATDGDVEQPAPIVAESPNQPIVDTSSPFYMHPSNNSGIALVPVPFDGFGYRSWRRGVMRALSVKNKLGFINGDCKRLDPDSSSYRLWERCDDMVTSWILNSLAKEIADSVEYVTDAIELWKELEDRYDQTNGTKLYQIQKEINDLSQGALDITGYYTKMKKLWEELTTLITKSHCTCNCTCGARESLLITDSRGKTKRIKPHNYLALGSSALNVNTNRTTSFKTNYSPNNSQSYRNRPFCDYCKRPGHTIEKCYKLHGYPQGSNQNQNPNLSHNQASTFNQNPRQNYNYGNNSGISQGTRFNRGNRGVANAHVAATDTQHTGDENCSAQNISLTKEEYSQIVNLLQQFQSRGGRDSSDNVNTSSANFAGMIACTSSIDFGKLSCECFKNRTDSWIIDSKASDNMTFNKSLLTNIITLPYPLLVILPNGYKVKVIEIGNVVLTPKITPNRAPSMKRPLVIGRVKDGLYILCPKCLKNNNTSPGANVIDFLSTPVTHCTCNT
ncbi:PREDICTED: uncharacterized protein LOC109226234 [Nicotiana attenuata]|uniref:uncharacterized protein LOC109226234 n=1 Tax=Nicotiana attenuata TaxID=49451 RepID=UPI000905B77D|nr:PREDICTED: uncharacterized protein LOC109226234 [Nicotiana attenuata]